MQMPKHIFLVHGEPDAQETLKEKIEETTGIGVTIPRYGEEYELNDELTKAQLYLNPIDKQQSRIDIIEKMQALEDELEEMKHTLKENIRLYSNSDVDMAKLNNRVNDLRKQIIEMMK